MDAPRPHYGMLAFLFAVSALAAILFLRENFELNLAVSEEERQLERVAKILSEIPVEAKALSVYDITAGRKIYGKNDEVPLPFASLAKTMTVSVALAEGGKEKNREVISISAEALGQFGDYGLLLHEKWQTEDLARLTMIASSNDGAHALGAAEKDFLKKINMKAKKIGMEHSFFLNFTGLDLEAGLPSAYSSALDANLLASYAIRAWPEVFSVTTKPEITLRSESGFEHTFKNTNIISGRIPNLLFSKTGFTELAGGNLSVVFVDQREHQIAVTVLGSSFEGRFADVERIVEALYPVVDFGDAQSAP